MEIRFGEIHCVHNCKACGNGSSRTGFLAPEKPGADGFPALPGICRAVIPGIVLQFNREVEINQIETLYPVLSEKPNAQCFLFSAETAAGFARRPSLKGNPGMVS